MLDFDLRKILILTPRIQLVHQLLYDFKDYGFDADKHVHMIFGGQEKDIQKPIFISTWQSLQDLPKEYFHQFDAVIVDEAHEATANEISRILDNCINAQYRIGMTGTIKDSQTHKIVLEGMFGKTIRSISTKELIEQGFAPNLKIKTVLLNYSDSTKNELKHSMLKYSKKDEENTKQQIAMKNYSTEIEYIVNNRKRNLFITSLALQQDKNCLVTFQYVEGEKKPHGKILYEMISKNTNRKVFFIHGKVDVEIREEIRKIVENEQNAIIVASTGVFAMGINIKNLHSIIMSSPSKDRIKIFQSIGRILRQHETKNEVIVYDIADDFRIEKYKNYTFFHFEKRLEFYHEERFNPKILEVKIQ